MTVKRPIIKRIIVETDEKDPIIFDPKETSAILLDDMGAEMLALYYESKGKKDEAEAVKKKWAEGVRLMWKNPNCRWFP